MTLDRRWTAVTVVVGAVSAAFGALPSAFDVDEGFRPVPWAIATGASVLAMSCFLASGRALLTERIPKWAWVVSALTLAAVAPYATESVLYATFADMGLAATAVAVMLAMIRPGVWSAGLMALTTGVACAFEPTAMILPVGCAWSAFTQRDRRAYAGVTLAAGVAGIVLGRVMGWPMLSGRAFHSVSPAIHHDLATLLPVMMLGWAGFARGLDEARADRCVAGALWLPGWTATAMIALIPAVLGVPVNVRICVLPLWWWMPIGLAELAYILDRRTGSGFGARGAVFLSSLVLAGVSVTGVRHLLDGPLLAVYILSQ